MIDDYSEINDIEAGCDCVPLDMLGKDEYLHLPVPTEFGYSSYVLDNDLGQLVVRGDSRVFYPKKECI